VHNVGIGLGLGMIYKWDKEQLGLGKIGWELEQKSTVDEVGIGRKLVEWDRDQFGSRQNWLGIGKDNN